MHEKADYKSVQALSDKQHEEIKLLNQEKEDLQVKLGEAIEQLILNNKRWEEKYLRMAKVYVGYKRKYIGLFGMKEAAESMGIDTDNYKPTEEDKKFMKGLEEKLLTFIGVNTPILRSLELENLVGGQKKVGKI